MASKYYAILFSFGFSLICRAETINAEKIFTLCRNFETHAPASVIIEGQIISDVRNASALTASSSLTITPGFFAVASQLGVQEVSAVSSSSDASTKNGEVSASFDASLFFNPRSELLPVVRQEGVLKSLISPSESTRLFGGLGTIVRLDSTDQWLVKSAAAVFMDLRAYGSTDYAGSKAVTLWKLQEAFEEALLWKKFKLEYQKAQLKKLSWSERDLIIITDVVEGKTPLIVTAHRASDITALLLFFKKFPMVRWVLRGGAEAWMIAADLAQAKIGVLIDPLANTPAEFDQRGARLDNAALLNKAGVKIAFYLNDDPHLTGKLRQMAGIAVSRGLPWAEALKAITINPYEILGQPYECLEKGTEATFVLWRGDPLDVSSTVEQIWVKGRPISLETRQTKLRDKYLKKLGLPH